MRYKPGYKAEKRKDLLSKAGKVLKEKGFSATGVDGLMQDAGGTSGAFYGHFGSKSELLRALIVSELEASQALWAQVQDQDNAAWLRHQMTRYLSMSHVQHPEAGCIVPALAAEISRADRQTRALLETELLKWQQSVAQRLDHDERAWAFICQLVGAVLVARAVASEPLQRVILGASKALLESSIPSSERHTPAHDVPLPAHSAI